MTDREIMAAKVTFVNKNDMSHSFKMNLFGPEKNRVRVATVLAVIKSSVALMDDGTVMEADEDGLSMDTFVAGRTYTLSLMPQGFGQLKLVDWLNQRLGRPRFKFGNPPSISCYYRNWPKNFHLWNIRDEADRFSLSFRDHTQRYPRVELKFPHMDENEAVSSAIMKSLLEILSAVPIIPEFSIRLQDTVRLTRSRSQGGTSSLSPAALQADRQASRTSETRGVYDLGCIVTDTEKLFYIVEMKSASLFRARETDYLPPLVDILDRFHNNSHCTGRERCMAQSTGQLFTYMVAKSIGFGALSTSDATYFVQRSVDNTIGVSEGFRWEDGDFLKTMAYTIYCGYTDTKCYNREGVEDKHFSSSTHPRSPASSRQKPVSDPTSGSSPGKSSSHVDSESSNLQGLRRTAGSAGFRPSQVSMDYTLRETRAEDLNMEDEPFACGWSGNVLKGVYNGVPIAIKLARRNSERAEALVNEAHTYLKLQGLWGVYVPHLVVWGTTAEGRVVFIATEFISGFELQPWRASSKVGWMAIQALKAVHNYGILHGDIRASNIMVLSDGVRLLDFGFSRSLRRGSYLDAAAADEVRQLEKLLGWSIDGLSQDIPTGALPWTPSSITC